jgi:CubicO group peptidase (beta-lactamase class C family)
MFHSIRAADPALALLVVVAACGPAQQPAPPDHRWSALARELPPLLAKHRVASVSIARVEHGEIVWTAAFGAQRPGVPATPDTLYNIASMTKPISSEVVVRLAAAGKLSLDEPMSAYWIDPDLAGDARHARLTPRLALSHRTGLPNWRRETGGVLAFKRDPAGAFGYSGEGFEYVARFVEHKLGTSFESLAQDLVLGPAGMTDTAYTHRPWFEGRVAIPTDAAGTSLAPSFATSLVASDLMYSTPRDYARFMLSVIRRDGVTAELAAERQRVQVSRKREMCAGPVAALCPRDVGIGLSWEVFQFGDETLLMHTGNDDGVTTFGYLNLASRSGTVIFTNSANGMQLVLPILDGIGADPGFVALLRKLGS